MKPTLMFALAPLACLLVQAAPLSFDFKDPKGVNQITFKLDAPLEAISGSASGVSGTVNFDPAAPDTLIGKIVVTTESMHVPNPMMKGHLHSDKWMDAAKYPEITFEVARVANVKTAGDETSADVTGDFTLKGVKKSITVPVRLTYLKGKLKDRVPNLQGDLLVLRSNFSIKRSDFSLNSGQFEDKVANEIQLSLSMSGQSVH